MSNYMFPHRLVALTMVASPNGLQMVFPAWETPSVVITMMVRGVLSSYTSVGVIR